jgi:hypothetical protein
LSFRRDDHSGGEKQVQRSGEQEEQAGVEVQVQRCTRCRGAGNVGAEV